MDVKTHILADKTLLGFPVEIDEGKSAMVQLPIIENMIIDDHGLVHGGFTFGLADYAAMLAVNDPNVVIGSANVRFKSPVQRGDIMIAKSKIIEKTKNKRVVHVEVFVEDTMVLNGELTCYILHQHVLSA